jgi:hypothetical protein
MFFISATSTLNAHSQLIYTTQYSDVHGYNTIHKHNLYVQFCNTERSKRGVISMGTKIFNGLPTELKNVKKKVKVKVKQAMKAHRVVRR